MTQTRLRVRYSRRSSSKFAPRYRFPWLVFHWHVHRQQLGFGVEVVECRLHDPLLAFSFVEEQNSQTRGVHGTASSQQSTMSHPHHSFVFAINQDSVHEIGYATYLVRSKNVGSVISSLNACARILPLSCTMPLSVWQKVNPSSLG